MTDTTLEITAELENAYFLGAPGEDQVLIGNIKGDVKRRFPDGLTIRTSLLMDEPEENVFVTRNSVYRVLSWGPPTYSIKGNDDIEENDDD